MQPRVANLRPFGVFALLLDDYSAMTFSVSPISEPERAVIRTRVRPSAPSQLGKRPPPPPPSEAAVEKQRPMAVISKQPAPPAPSPKGAKKPKIIIGRTLLISVNIFRQTRDFLIQKPYSIDVISRQISLMYYERDCRPDRKVPLQEAMGRVRSEVLASPIDKAKWNRFVSFVHRTARGYLEGTSEGIASRENLLMLCKRFQFADFESSKLAYELTQMYNAYLKERPGLERLAHNVRALATELRLVLDRAETLRAFELVFFQL